MRSTKLTLVWALAFILGAAGSSPVLGEIEEVRAKMSGLSCPFCARGVEKNLEKIEGIEDATIHLKKGEASIVYADGATFDLERISKAITHGGFTLDSVEITAVGFVVADSKGIMLNVRDVEATFILYENQALMESEHDGDEPPMLTAKMKSRLEDLAAGGQLVRITGYVHAHEDQTFGLSVNRFEEVEG